MKWVIGIIVIIGLGVLVFISLLKDNLNRKKEVEIKSYDRINRNDDDIGDDDMGVVRKKMLEGLEEDK